MSKGSISIMGCGWLGIQVAKRFISEDWEVKGSTRKYEKSVLLQRIGIRNFVIDITPRIIGNITVFLETDILIICIPPGIRTQPGGYHAKQMENLSVAIKNSQVKNIIYISSTSIYPDGNQTYKENDITSVEACGHGDIYTAEEILRSNFGDRLTILRSGGLAGYDRFLAKYFAGKSDLLGGSSPINLIHRDDIEEIIHLVIEKAAWGKTYNACAPLHPTRKEFYTYEAKKYGLPAPEFAEDLVTPWKIIDPSALISDLGYQYKFADPHNFTYTF